jgi:hypothetical protein
VVVVNIVRHLIDIDIIIIGLIEARVEKNQDVDQKKENKI